MTKNTFNKKSALLATFVAAALGMTGLASAEIVVGAGQGAGPRAKADQNHEHRHSGKAKLTPRKAGEDPQALEDQKPGSVQAPGQKPAGLLLPAVQKATD